MHTCRKLSFEKVSVASSLSFYIFTKMKKEGIKSYYPTKTEECELVLNEESQDLRRLEAQRNALNTKGKETHPIYLTKTKPFVVCLLKEELQLLQNPASM